MWRLLLTSLLWASIAAFPSLSPCESDASGGLACRGLSSLWDVAGLLNSEHRRLHVSDSALYQLDLAALANATGLEELRVVASEVDEVHAHAHAPPLRVLDLSGNALCDARKTLGLIRLLPALESLDLSGNRLELDCGEGPLILSANNGLTLDLSRNRLSDKLCLRLGGYMKIMNLSLNSLDSLGTSSLPDSLQVLDLSGNRLTALSALLFPSLARLRLQRNLLSTPPKLNAPRLTHLSFEGNPMEWIEAASFAQINSLKELSLGGSELRWLDLTALAPLRRLQSLDVSRSSRLESFLGSLSPFPDLRFLDLRGCRFRSLRSDFLEAAAKLRVDIRRNPLHCGACALWWKWNAPRSLVWEALNETTCATPPSRVGEQLLHVPVNLSDPCALGHDEESARISTARYKRNATLHCPVYARGRPSVSWLRLEGPDDVVHIGGWADGRVVTFRRSTNNRSQDVLPLPSGSLLLLGVTGQSVGHYICVVGDQGDTRNATLFFHLDYSFWTIRVYIYSLFCGVATALGFFALNVMWAGIRTIVLWRLRQMENTSRLKKMLEAVEKYRQRQLETLHEEYTSRMTQIRDNYQSQSERLRSSYSSRSASVQASVSSMRDNYTSQMGRVRDYGSQATERLWESYQRQVNRIRTFSLQQRLRLMRQYKVRQSALNSILESLNMDANWTWKAASKPDQMGMPTLDEVDEDSMSLDSFHSLPNEEFQHLPTLEELTEGISSEQDGERDTGV